MCGGGRYDGLVEQLGELPQPAWAMGIERLMLLLAEQSHQGQQPDVVVISQGASSRSSRGSNGTALTSERTFR